MNIDVLLENKDNIDEFAPTLKKEDIDFLVSLLTEKNDEIRYAAFLALRKRSELYPDVYPYWDVFAGKLTNENSYQRSIGIMLIAQNVKWDEKNLFSDIFPLYMDHCTDEKFVTSRQTIQGITKWLLYTPNLHKHIINKLTAIEINIFKETQQKLILIDILNVLLEISKVQRYDEIDSYVSQALTGGLLDKKSIKQFEKLFS